MSVSAFAMLKKFVKKPVAAVFAGALASNGTVTGLGSNSATGTLGTISAGNRIKGPYTISAIASTSSANLVMYMTGNVPEAAFTSVVAENGAGTPTTFLRSAATFVGYLAGVNQTAWSWGNGSSRCWETTDNTETKKVIVV